MLVNVVDVPSLCNFILPAVSREGPLAIAISTSGASPMLAARMKREIAEQFGSPTRSSRRCSPRCAAGRRRRSRPTPSARRFFAAIIDGDPDPIELLRAGDLAAVKRLIADAKRSFAPRPPSRRRRRAAAMSVYLVGAGPGDPGLMTARSLELIAAADVILYDRLIPDSALDGARPDATLIYAGKEPGGPSMSQRRDQPAALRARRERPTGRPAQGWRSVHLRTRRRGG